MSEPKHSIRIFARSVAGVAIGVGDVVIPSASVDGLYVVATTANRGTRRSEGVALTPAGGNKSTPFELQSAGTLDASVSGLGSGTASWVRVSSAGRLERVATPGAGDDLVGRCEADGRVHLSMGTWDSSNYAGGGGGGGVSPGGVADSIQANNGSGGLTGYSTALVGDGYISLGSSPSTTGAIRLDYNERIAARNEAGTNDRNLIWLSTDGSRDVIRVGSSSGCTIAIGGTAGQDVLVNGDDFEVRNGGGSQLWFWVDSTVSACKFVSAMPWIGADGTIFFYKFFGPALAADRQVSFPTLTGDDTFVFAAHTQTLTNKTLTSPVLGGTPVYTAARGSVRSFVGEVQTSSTTQTTAVAYTMTNETLCAFDVIVTCARRTNVTKGGRYKRSVVYRRTGGGAPTIVGALEAGTDQETTAGDDVTIDVSGNDVRVRVTAADTDQRNWLCELRAQETLAT